MPSPLERPAGNVDRAFIDLHCHTSASFDSLASPGDVVRAAARRGLTHLAVTDHDRIDGALRARDAAPDGLTIIIGEEVTTSDGDLIAAFLVRAVPPGLTALDAIEAIRDQRGLVGIPHPFDRSRGYGRTSGADLADIAARVDWLEAHNARVVGDSANEQAAIFAAEHSLPGVCASLASRTTSSSATLARPRDCSRRSPRWPAWTCSPAVPAPASGSGRRWRRRFNPAVETVAAGPGRVREHSPDQSASASVA